MALKFILVALLMAMGSAYAFADQPDDVLPVVIDLMTSQGFENVRAFAQSDTLGIEYENRVYFREKDALCIIIPKLISAAPDVNTFKLTTKRDNVPLFQFTIPRNDYQISKTTEQKITDISKTSPITAFPNREEKVHNPSFGKVDITIHPFAKIALGRYYDPFIPKYSISPEASIFWGSGIKSIVRLQYILDNELEKRGRSLAMDGLYINYTYRKTDLRSLDLYAGYFGMNRYGLNSDAILFGWNNKVGIGCSAAYLGNMYYVDNIIYYTKMWNWTALADLYYRVPSLNMLFTARFGRFLHQDIGVSGDVTRFFKNVGVGAFATKTDQGSALGIRLQFLTYPRRNIKPYYVRLKLPTIIKMEYRNNEGIIGTKFSPKYNDVGNITDSLWLMDFH
jgi:hypothetical protein